MDFFVGHPHCSQNVNGHTILLFSYMAQNGYSTTWGKGVQKPRTKDPRGLPKEGASFPRGALRANGVPF